MAAMTPVPERDRAIRDAIATLYGVTHPTMLTYELLAHLVKHRYVDAIITRALQTAA
jgi:deoxyhypusine synthase